MLRDSLHWRLRPAFLLSDREAIGALPDRPPRLCTPYWPGPCAPKCAPKSCCPFRPAGAVRGYRHHPLHSGQVSCSGEYCPSYHASGRRAYSHGSLRQTSGLVDLFGSTSLVDDISAWSQHKGHDVHAAVNYLVLAIGLQSVDDSLASSYFEHAKVLALATLGSELSVGTVQAFTLITIYMLRACQITGAFLFFG